MTKPRRLGDDARAMLCAIRIELDQAREDAGHVRQAIRSGKALEALDNLAGLIDTLSEARVLTIRVLNGDFDKREREE